MNFTKKILEVKIENNQRWKNSQKITLERFTVVLNELLKLLGFEVL